MTSSAIRMRYSGVSFHLRRNDSHVAAVADRTDLMIDSGSYRWTATVS